MAFFRAVKTPETPRSYLPKLADPPPPVHEEREREAKIVPRYVEIPALRERGFGPRNLFWGLATLFLALVILIVALFFAGPKATVSLATALLTFTALFVLARLHVFRQRNGGFLALAIVCLLGAAVPLLESGFSALKGSVSFSRASGSASTSSGGDGQVPILKDAFALPPLEGNGKRVKVLKDSKVIIGDRPFLIKAGDQFSLLGVKNGEATFVVRDLEVSLPASVVDVIDPIALLNGVSGRRLEPDPAPSAPESSGPAASPTAPGPGPASAPAAPTPQELAAIQKNAQQEAVRLYPALGVRDSIENMTFLSAVQKLKSLPAGANFFADPEWPIALADQLAKRDGWVRGAAPMTTNPAPVLDGPAVPTTSDGSTAPPADVPDAGTGSLPSSRNR